jgi:hypothetical protein
LGVNNAIQVIVIPLLLFGKGNTGVFNFGKPLIRAFQVLLPHPQESHQDKFIPEIQENKDEGKKDKKNAVAYKPFCELVDGIAYYQGRQY